MSLLQAVLSLGNTWSTGNQEAQTQHCAGLTAATYLLLAASSLVSLALKSNTSKMEAVVLHGLPGCAMGRVSFSQRLEGSRMLSRWELGLDRRGFKLCLAVSLRLLFCKTGPAGAISLQFCGGKEASYIMISIVVT